MSDIYTIRTVKDFLTVPHDKRADMLADFIVWMEMADRLAAAFDPSELSVIDHFKWVDDGITGCSEINLHFEEKVTP